MTGAGIMDLSLNEVETQATKAARGAGLAWGQAEDVGHAARWLAERDIDWASALLQFLADVDAASTLSRAGRLADDLSASRGEVICPPLWTMALLSMSCRARRQAVGAEWPGLRAAIDSDGGVWLDRRPAEIGFAASPVRIVPEQGRPLGERLAATARRSRVEIGKWHELEAFVIRTYVPSSLQSRSSGAGSGLSDND